ncbi:MAG: Fis family transcriptional regulator [Mycobacterium sp.]|nr:Fis family transcriptional regulator [Mycobacterium sp.]
MPLAVTAERFEDLPGALAGLIDTVVHLPPLRERPNDVLPLAAHITSRARGREVEFSQAASRALQNYGWPGNVDQLSRVVVYAANRTDIVDVANLPPEVLSDNTRHLSRIEAFERREIVRVLATGNRTMQEAGPRARDESGDALPQDRSVQHSHRAQGALVLPRAIGSRCRIHSGQGIFAKVVASTQTCVIVHSAMTSRPRLMVNSLQSDVFPGGPIATSTTSSSSKVAGRRKRSSAAATTKSMPWPTIVA